MRDPAFTGLAVGFFDGVHLGHQAILRGVTTVLTFRNHPLAVLAPAKAPRLIMTCEERIAAIKACGVREVKVLEFTPELAALSATEFVTRYLSTPVRCGANWRFGRDGVGDADFLRGRGFEVEVVPFVDYQGAPISSSRIRAAIERGAIEAANAMLGREFQVSGRRFKGKGLGAKIGYPTVNLQLSSLRLSPPLGVYEAEVAGARAVANFGVAPTTGDRAWPSPVMELHVLGKPSFGEADELTVSLLRFIRPERKFASLADLQAQIGADCATIGL